MPASRVPARRRSGPTPVAFVFEAPGQHGLERRAVGAHLAHRSCPDVFGLRRAGLQSDAEGPMEAGCPGRVQFRRWPIGVRWWRGRRPCCRWVSDGYARGRSTRRRVGAFARAPPARHARRELGGDLCPAPLGNVERAELPRWRVAAAVVPIHDRLTSPARGEQTSKMSSRVLRIVRSIGGRRRPQSSAGRELPRMDNSTVPMGLGARNRPPHEARGGAPAFSVLKRSLVAGLVGPSYPVIPMGRRRGRPERG